MSVSHFPPPKRVAGYGSRARQPYRASDARLNAAKRINSGTARTLSSAKAWTESRMPERTISVPSNERISVSIASSNDQWRKLPRWRLTYRLCSNALAASHGNNEAFSTGSQNHQPPQPSSQYAHHDPRMIPSVRAHQPGNAQRQQTQAVVALKPPHSSEASATLAAVIRPP